MRCLECDHRVPVSRGGVRDYHCAFTGCQVAEFAMIGSSEDTPDRDDPNGAMCPLTLDRMLDSQAGAYLAEGVLTQVSKRGQLKALLKAYQGRRREVLTEFVQQMA